MGSASSRSCRTAFRSGGAGIGQCLGSAAWALVEPAKAELGSPA